MPIADTDTLIEALKLEMGASVDLITDESYARIAEKTMLELRWVFPVTDSFKEFWTVERARRHALYLLYVEAAQKFKYKQISLNQRFDHYAAIIKQMDEAFKVALDENPAMFPGVATDAGFTQYIGAGFEYSDLGADVSPSVNVISGDE